MENYSDKNGDLDPRIKLNSFVEETKALCQGYKLPQNLQFYLDIGELGIKSLYSNKRAYYESLLADRYIDFLKEIMLESGKFVKE